MVFALRQVNRRTLPAGFAFTLLASAISLAHADQVTDLGAVGTQAEASGSGAPAAQPAAVAAAPAAASLKTTEPQSVISRSYIEDSRAADSDYTAVTAIAPSVSGGITTNGPGLGETKNTIRGFQDGQYNITWDGIPFGDTNGPTHHSTAYFPAEVIGSIDVERGPGNADNIGQATFGGSINLFSRPLTKDEVFSPYLSVGSWDTKLKGANYQTGDLADYGDLKASINYQQLTSDGYQTFSGVNNQNLAFKVEKPLSDNTVMTINLNHDTNVSHVADASNGITLAQAAQFGKNYLLSADPTQGTYYGYNVADKSTDMDYVRLQSALNSGWKLDNTLYYYNYVNDTYAANNVTPGNAPEVSNSSSCVDANNVQIANCIPGYEKINKYWVSGDIFKANKDFDAGNLLAGAWVEHAETFRARFTEDMVNGETIFAAQKPAGPFDLNYIKYDQGAAWNNYQPFVEFAWKPIKDLTVTPGFKYVNTLVNIDAQENQGSRVYQNLDKLFTAKLPYLTVNYRLTDNWSTYAQYAKGMVVPDISSFQSSNAELTDIQPQMTTNYQLGIVEQSERVAFDADVYDIKFDNMIAQVPGSPSSEPIYYNAGGANYKGLEGELSVVVLNGFSVFANGSANHARSTTTGLEIANAPLSTDALGAIYKLGNWNASYVFKRVGEEYVLPDATYKMNGYSSTDLMFGYTFNPSARIHRVKLEFGIYNLQNHQSVLSINPSNTTAGTAGYGLPSAGDTYTFQPERSYMGSLSLSI